MTASPDSIDSQTPDRAGWWIVALAMVAFLGLRLPMMYREGCGEDEDVYAVPGLTILENGVPRIPHVPARNAESVYLRADEGLFAEPPVFFYWESLFYAVFPHTAGTARLASAIAGMAVLWLTYRLAIACGVRSSTAGLVCFALSLSRWFFFAATRARPDMLCAALSLGALLAVHRWTVRPTRGGLVLIGFLIGLAGLTHPIAIVFAMQVAAWIAWSGTGRQRVIGPMIVAGVALLTAMLWLPLIVKFPEAFRAQFVNQFLRGTAGEAQAGAIPVWSSIAYHAPAVWWYFGPVQCVLLMGSVMAGAWFGRRGSSLVRVVPFLAASACVMTVLVVGAHHRIFGYFVVPASLSFVSLAVCLDATCCGRTQTRWPGCVPALVLLALLVPGSGLRMAVEHWKRWNDPRGDVRAFCREMMSEIPAEAVVVVDSPFAVEFVAARRKALLGQTLPAYFRVQDLPSDFVVLGRQALTNGLRTTLKSTPWKRFGVEEDSGAFYAEVDTRTGE